MQSPFELLQTSVQRAGFECQFGALTQAQLEPVASALSLSPDLIEWYSIAAPLKVSLLWHGGWTPIYNPLELIECQEGYRWAVGHQEIDPGWNTNWVVIGDIHGDPMIAHVDEPQTPVSLSMHGAGEWRLQRVAPSLGLFLTALAAWTDVAAKYQRSLSTDDGILRPDVLADIRSEWRAYLPPDMAAAFLTFLE